MPASPGPAELLVLIKEDFRVPEHRRLFCESYDQCLDQAVAAGWVSWTCARCPSFQAEEHRRIDGFAQQHKH